MYTLLRYNIHTHTLYTECRYNPYYMLNRVYKYYEVGYSYFLAHCRNIETKSGTNHRQLK